MHKYSRFFRFSVYCTTARQTLPPLLSHNEQCSLLTCRIPTLSLCCFPALPPVTSALCPLIRPPFGFSASAIFTTGRLLPFPCYNKREPGKTPTPFKIKLLRCIISQRFIKRNNHSSVWFFANTISSNLRTVLKCRMNNTPLIRGHRLKCY